MLRAVLQRGKYLTAAVVRTNAVRSSSLLPEKSGLTREQEEDFISQKICDVLNKPEIDGWELRSMGNDFAGEDLIPDADICIAYVNACRRENDYALAMRFMEWVRHRYLVVDKNGWENLKRDAGPAFEEIGMDFPEDLGYDKPELAIKDVETNDYYA